MQKNIKTKIIFLLFAWTSAQFCALPRTTKNFTSKITHVAPQILAHLNATTNYKNTKNQEERVTQDLFYQQPARELNNRPTIIYKSDFYTSIAARLLCSQYAEIDQDHASRLIPRKERLEPEEKGALIDILAGVASFTGTGTAGLGAGVAGAGTLGSGVGVGLGILSGPAMPFIAAGACVAWLINSSMTDGDAQPTPQKCSDNIAHRDITTDFIPPFENLGCFDPTDLPPFDLMPPHGYRPALNAIGEGNIKGCFDPSKLPNFDHVPCLPPYDPWPLHEGLPSFNPMPPSEFMPSHKHQNYAFAVPPILVIGEAIIGGGTTTGIVLAPIVVVPVVVVGGGYVIVQVFQHIKNRKEKKKLREAEIKGSGSSSSTNSPDPDKDPDKNKKNKEKNPNGEYEENPKHHQNSKGDIGKPPPDGQKALNESIAVPGKDFRVAIQDGKIVQLNQHSPGRYHGYIIEKEAYKKLSDIAKNALYDAGLIRDTATGRVVK
jgi:hypothetical protein